MELSYRTVQEKTTTHLHDLGFGDGALNIIPEAQKTMKNIHASSDILMRGKKQPGEGQECFHTISLLRVYYVEHVKDTNNMIQKWIKDPIRHVS